MKNIDNGKITRMFSEGMKQSEIAAHFGVSPGTISYRIKKIKLQEMSSAQTELDQGDEPIHDKQEQEPSTATQANTRPHNGRYFKNIKTGTVWHWTPVLEKNKDELHLRESDADGNLV